MIIKKIYHEEEIKLNLKTLKEQNLDHLDLNHAILSGMDLSGSSMSGTKLRVAQLKSSNLDNANLSYADISKANFEKATLINVDMQNVSSSSAIFRDADLKDTNLTNANLAGAYLLNANLKNADLTNATFERGMLYGADMRGLNIETVKFQGAMFDQNTKWPEEFNPSSKGAQIVGNPIKKLVEDLDFGLSEEIQEGAIYELSKIKPQFYYLLFKGSKYTWPNAVKIIKQIGYPKNKLAIPNLLELLMDTNWPGAIDAMGVLAEITKKDKSTLIKELEKAICKAYSDGDPCWLWGINHFIEYYSELKEQDFYDSEIFRLLKYGDEENYTFDYGIQNFLKS